MRRQHFFIDTGLIVVALGIAYGNDLDEVAVSGLIFCKQNQVALTLVEVRLLISMSAGCGIYLASDDGLDALSLAFLVEINCAEHGSMVRYGH